MLDKLVLVALDGDVEVDEKSIEVDEVLVEEVLLLELLIDVLGLDVDRCMWRK